MLRHEPIGMNDGGLALMGIFLLLTMLMVGGRLEIRQRGIVNMGRLWRWVDIESYEWEADPPSYLVASDENTVLKVNLRRKLPFLAPVRLSVPIKRVPAVYDAQLAGRL
jgi:hypothetical protein